ncbi:MAG: transposase family protein [Leptolyngbya sp. DLM2.Bin27]|nr:MAG: transposase family protein [Leptolyngbya sp. DLM2.Bin27]
MRILRLISQEVRHGFARSLSLLIEPLQALEAPRCSYLVKHRLLDIIGLVLCAVIYGADTWVDIAAYGRAKADWLRGFLSLPHGISSHDTIARLLAALDPEAVFTWVRQQ